MRYEVLTKHWFNGVRTKVLWTTGQRTPTYFHLPWLRVSPEQALRMIAWFDFDLPFDRSFWIDELFGLCSAYEFVAYQVQLPERLEIVSQSILAGHITVWREALPFTGPSGDQPIDNAVLAPLYREYAKQIGMDPGTVVAPPAAGSGHKPVIPAAADVPLAEQGKPLPNAVSESCPAKNWRSESHRTAAPEVIRWLQDPEKEGRTLAESQDEVLGFEGGGGFLTSTTRISQLRKGDIVFRYYDAAGNISNAGGWWTTQLVEGDPRQTLALPPADPRYSNSAQSLARAQIGFDITVLTGVGAPRCSNKPGGPQQWFISYHDRKKKGVLRHPDNPSLPFPDDPPQLPKR